MEKKKIFEGLEIQGRDDFEDEMLPVDDDAAAEAGETENASSAVHHLNTYNMRIPGEEGEENKHKSKKEVMEEIISKSKFFKAQKAKDKEENEHLLEDLDRNFTSLVHSQALLSLTEPSKMHSLKALVNKSIPNEPSTKDGLSGSRKIDKPEQEKPYAYDKLVKEMALEIRARPSDRTKTPEEIAQEERERLEQLEEERQKRMTAVDGSSDEDDEDSEKPSKHRPKFLSGDDLGDSFSVSEETNEETKTKKRWIDEILERRDEEDFSSEDGEDSESSEDADEGSDEDLDEHEHKLSLKDWEQSDDDNIGPNLEEIVEDSGDDEEKEKDAEYARVNNEKKDLDSGSHKCKEK